MGSSLRQRLRRSPPDVVYTPIDVTSLVLTVSDKEEDLFRAIKAGARGYLLKHEDPENIIQAVQPVADGGLILSPHMAQRLLNEFKTQPQANITDYNSHLSQREWEVLQLLAHGLRDKEIASVLTVPRNTVKDKLH